MTIRQSSSTLNSESAHNKGSEDSASKLSFESISESIDSLPSSWMPAGIVDRLYAYQVDFDPVTHYLLRTADSGMVDRLFEEEETGRRFNTPETGSPLDAGDRRLLKGLSSDDCAVLEDLIQGGDVAKSRLSDKSFNETVERIIATIDMNARSLD